LQVKIELELIIEEKFEKVKKINPNSANVLLEKYSWLKDFLIAPELVTSQNTENVQPPWNILNAYDENYKPEYSVFWNWYEQWRYPFAIKNFRRRDCAETKNISNN
jgi:hypothetical protein